MAETDSNSTYFIMTNLALIEGHVDQMISVIYITRCKDPFVGLTLFVRARFCAAEASRA
jgi:hypothetical protein